MIHRTHTRRWPLVLASVLLVALGLVAGVALTSSFNWQSPVHARETASGGPVPQSPFVGVAERVLPAVVFIDTKQTIAGSGSGDDSAPFDNGPFGDFFREFGMQNPHRGPMTVPASGSGFIVSPDGYILTNAHVVKNATDIKVRLHDGREFKARKVGVDATADVAVVKIDARDLPTVVEGSSEDMRVGDWAVAIGNPGGLEGTVTVGVISAKGRSNLAIEGGSPQYQDFIQTDAPINFGNSGGPLCNINGDVIGINTAINPSSQGIGFAIPIELAKSRSQQLIAHGKVVRGYLGILPNELSPAIASGFGLPEDTKGVVVGQVEANTPAARAGFHEGDVITRFNGKSVKDVTQVRFAVADAQPGERVNVEILRNGHPMTLSAVLKEFPADQVASNDNSGDDQDQGMTGDDTGPSVDVKWLGVSVRTLTPAVAREMNLTDSHSDMHGVVITDVEDGSAASEAQLLRNDIVKSVNGQAVASAREFRDAVACGRKGRKALVLFVRRGTATTFIGVPVPQG